MKTELLCVYHDKENRVRNKCLLLRDEYPCRPDKCEWYTTQEDRILSFVKAVMVWQKNHTGRWEESGIVPERFIQDVKLKIFTEKLKRDYSEEVKNA